MTYHVQPHCEGEVFPKRPGRPRQWHQESKYKSHPNDAPHVVIAPDGHLVLDVQLRGIERDLCCADRERAKIAAEYFAARHVLRTYIWATGERIMVWMTAVLLSIRQGYRWHEPQREIVSEQSLLAQERSKRCRVYIIHGRYPIRRMYRRPSSRGPTQAKRAWGRKLLKRYHQSG